MKIQNKTNINILNDTLLNEKFINTGRNKSGIDCNILKDNFFIDSFNYFPISEKGFVYDDYFTWGDKKKYLNFFSENFEENFKKNKKNFKNFSNIFVLGSSSVDNYYRNLITFLPRLLFIQEKTINLAIHRNSSNKLRLFIEQLCSEMSINVKFTYLDDGFYKFNKSYIPQFFDKKTSIKILNQLKSPSSNKKEKLFISRQNCKSRNLVNEGDVSKILKKNGFRILDMNDFNIVEQIKLFSHAEVVVSATGSALTNLIFCNPLTKVYEISPKYQFGYENNFKNRYEFIAENLNLEYFRIEADSINIKNLDTKIKQGISKKILNESNYYKDLIVKLDQIEKILSN